MTTAQTTQAPPQAPPQAPQAAESMDDISGSLGIETATIEGFTKDKPLMIGSLTAGDMIEFSESNEGEAKKTAGLRLITKSLVNSKGERYAADPKNIAVFRAKSHKATERIVREILKLNGIEIREDKKAEERAKNA